MPPGIARASWILAPFLVSLRQLVGTVPARSLPVFAWRFGRVQRFVPCPHTITELAEIAAAIAARPELPGAVVECGCFKGGSTARLSLVCDLLGRDLVVFDSFEGLPEPEPWDAEHEIQRLRIFARGEYGGTLAEVRANVAAYGKLERCRLVPGWFSDTMPDATPTVAVAFVDADLVASTRDALDSLWPRIAPAGVVFVHDATDPKLAAFLGEWRDEHRPTAASDLPTNLAWFVK